MDYYAPLSKYYKDDADFFSAIDMDKRADGYLRALMVNWLKAVWSPTLATTPTLAAVAALGMGISTRTRLSFGR